MSEGNGHERIEPTREQIKQALERIRKGQERLAETVEGKGLPKLGAKDADAFIQALIDNPILREMPASEEELERWERENPENKTSGWIFPLPKANVKNCQKNKS